MPSHFCISEIYIGRCTSPVPVPGHQTLNVHVASNGSQGSQSDLSTSKSSGKRCITACWCETIYDIGLRVKIIGDMAKCIDNE